LSKLEYRIVLTAFRLEGQMRMQIERDGLNGWRVQCVGRDMLVMERTDEARYDQRLALLSWHSPQLTLESLQKEAARGWDLGAVGPQFIIYHRPAGREEPLPYEYRSENIAILPPAKILEQANELGRQGWEIRSFDAAFAYYRRNVNAPQQYKSHLENVSMKTPRGIELFLAMKGEEKWRISGIFQIYMVLTQPLPLAPG